MLNKPIDYSELKTDEKNHVGQSILVPTIVDEYLNHLELSKKNRKNRKVFLTKFMKFISHNYFDNCPLSNIDFHLIELHHIQTYIKEINEHGFASNYLFHLKGLFSFIGINHFNTILQTKKPRKRTYNYDIVISFGRYLKEKKYSKIITYEKHINQFIKFLKINLYNLDITSTNTFFEIEESNLIAFEKHLVLKAEKKIITKRYVYAQLRSLSLFLKFLREKNVTDLRYNPPRFLQRNATRRNDYIEEIEIKEMMKMIPFLFIQSKYFYRNTSIFLILMYTGCRPIEVSNMNICDIWKNDCTILLKSKKSKHRRLRLNKEILFYIKKYLKQRKSFAPIDDDSLFVTMHGTRLSPASIYDILHKINKQLYGESKNPPVAFRHTFITNAFESGADLKTIADAAGHKHIASTDYYRQKSPERLLKNTINHDPVIKFEEDFNLGYCK